MAYYFEKRGQVTSLGLSVTIFEFSYGCGGLWGPRPPLSIKFFFALLPPSTATPPSGRWCWC